MHDTFLLSKISKLIEKICKENKIKTINQFSIIVNINSHINEESLKEHLINYNQEIINENLVILMRKENIEEQTAIIENIQGEECESL